MGVYKVGGALALVAVEKPGDVDVAVFAANDLGRAGKRRGPTHCIQRRNIKRQRPRGPRDDQLIHRAVIFQRDLHRRDQRPIVAPTARRAIEVGQKAIAPELVNLPVHRRDIASKGMGAGAKLALVADADIGRKVFQRRAHHRLLLHDALPATLHLGLLRQRRHPSLVLGHVVADDAVVVVGVYARRTNPRLPRLALRPVKLALRALRLWTQLRLRDLGPGGIKLPRLGHGQLGRLLLRTAHRQRRHGQRRRLQRFGRRRRGQRQVVRVAGAILQLGHLALIVAGRLALVRRCRGGLLPGHVLDQVAPVVLRVLGGAMVLLS